MFDPVGLIARGFATHLAHGYREVYGRNEPDHTPTLRAIARLAVERIGDSDALYHRLSSHRAGHPGRSGDPARAAHGRDRHAGGLAALHRRHAPARYRLSAWRLPRRR